MIIKRKKALKCKRCYHEWDPRKEDVRICPKCKSASWDLDRKHGKKKI